MGKILSTTVRRKSALTKDKGVLSVREPMKGIQNMRKMM